MFTRGSGRIRAIELDECACRFSRARQILESREVDAFDLRFHPLACIYAVRPQRYNRITLINAPLARASVEVGFHHLRGPTIVPIFQQLFFAANAWVDLVSRQSRFNHPICNIPFLHPKNSEFTMLVYRALDVNSCRPFELGVEHTQRTTGHRCVAALVKPSCSGALMLYSTPLRYIEISSRTLQSP